MARKGFTSEQIIGFLREAEVRLGHGQKAGQICRKLGISEQTYYRWRREYGWDENLSSPEAEGPGA